MTKPETVQDLQRRIRRLESELEQARNTQSALKKRDKLAREAEQLALLGHWELDLTTGTLFWSDEIYRIFELDRRTFGASYEAFIEAIHPDDRETVNRTYTESVKTRTSYDIVHRLRLADGSIKYVRERCRTEYGTGDRPMRSVGTVQDITEQMRSRMSFAGIIGREPRMREVFEAIEQLADVKVPVLIQGESGTGKELVAHAIHNEGPRASRPFVPVNCGALPENLIESELFGHVKGAFTGAIRDKRGRFELADGGTLFLDEVADLTPTMQVKLLRVLQDGRFERVGDEKSLSVDVRIISAANRDLTEEVNCGCFREDLYYRLRVMPLQLPALRERRNDIPLLVDHFMQMAAHEGLAYAGISDRALSMLLDFPWPGNVRELQSAVRFALIKSRGQIIEPEHLPLEMRDRDAKKIPHAEFLEQTSHERRSEGRGRKRKLDERSVSRALEDAGGNKAEASRNLGVGRATLYRFLNK